MHTDRIPEGLKEHPLLDRAVLNLMLDPEHQRPWAEDEIARALKIPGDVRESLRRLRVCKLIHRWNDLATAAHAAVRHNEITQGTPENANDAHERHDERAVLEALLARRTDGESPQTEQQIANASGAKKKTQRLAISDALDRLQAAGLIERRCGHSTASDVAVRLDELMSV